MGGVRSIVHHRLQSSEQECHKAFFNCRRDSSVNSGDYAASRCHRKPQSVLPSHRFYKESGGYGRLSSHRDDCRSNLPQETSLCHSIEHLFCAHHIFDCRIRLKSGLDCCLVGGGSDIQKTHFNFSQVTQMGHSCLNLLLHILRSRALSHPPRIRRRTASRVENFFGDNLR